MDLQNGGPNGESPEESPENLGGAGRPKTAYPIAFSLAIPLAIPLAISLAILSGDPSGESSGDSSGDLSGDPSGEQACLQGLSFFKVMAPKRAKPP